MKTYFVTGATGTIGSALIPLLLEDNDTEVYLLIRADNKEHLADRLKHLYHFWEFEENDERKERISAIAGNTQFSKFGFDTKLYCELSHKCTHIVHSAGNVRMNLSIEDARDCSVLSAKNIIELAKVCKSNNNLKKIEFVSTVGVGGRMKGIIPEEWLTEKREFHNTYEQAKAEAEDFIKLYADKGFPITVHRPSMVVGDSKTGKIIHFQIFYHLCEFLSGSRTLGVTPDTGKTCLDIIPSDYVAGVIAWSSRTEETISKVLHECSGFDNAILILDLKKQVQKVFKEHGKFLSRPLSIPIWLFKSLLPVIAIFVSPEAKRAMKALPVFFDYLAENTDFSNVKTKKIIEKRINTPEINYYLKNTLDCYLEKKR